jgi:hypothetical protein
MDDNRKKQLRSVSESYFQALRDKDFSAIPFSEDIVFRARWHPGECIIPLTANRQWSSNGGNRWSRLLTGLK